MTYSGHVTPDGPAAVHELARLTVSKLSVGPMDNNAYLLTDGSGVSEILAINDHQFLVDERDGKGMADTPLLTDKVSAAKVKKLYLIDLDGAQDVTSLSGNLSPYGHLEKPQV